MLKTFGDLGRPEGTDPVVAVVTGATGGIGQEIVRGLLAAGAVVVVGVRSPDKGEALWSERNGNAASGRIEILPLDLADMQSVREFAAQVRRDYPSLNILINNAGAWFNERRETAAGHELTLATNVLGPYLLTKLLQPQLRASGQSRIVNIVSAAVGDFDLNDLQWRTRRYSGFRTYRQSKQALHMLTQQLARTLKDTGVVVNAASPGFVRTSFLRNASGLVAAGLRAISFLAVSPAKGAETPLWLALSPETAGSTGKLYENLKEKAGPSY